MPVGTQIKSVFPDQRTIEAISDTFFDAVVNEGTSVGYLLQIAEEASRLAEIREADVKIRVQAANIAYLAFTTTVNRGISLTEDQKKQAEMNKKLVTDYDEAQKQNSRYSRKH